MTLGTRGLSALVLGSTAAMVTALSTPALAHPAGTPANPYSPAYGHLYRHGVVPTLAQHAG